MQCASTLTTVALTLLICPLTQPVTSKRQRQSHSNKRDSTISISKNTTVVTSGLSSLSPSSSTGPKRSQCGVQLKKDCYCSKGRGFSAISCSDAQLQEVPTFEMASSVVMTLNLENNFISDIENGDFYGLKINRLFLGNNSLSRLNALSLWGLEYYLETLNISCNQFYTVPSSALQLLRHLRTLILSHNNIRHLTGYGFSSLDKLEDLALDNNPIDEIDRHAFAGTNLYGLILDKLKLPKGLAKIPTGDLETLKGLSVAMNDIYYVPDQWFSNLTSLRSLKMDNNHLSRLDPGAFGQLSLSLRTLQLNCNKFRKVPQALLCHLVNLEKLELSRNRIKKIAGRTFNCSRNLQILDLSRNHISEMSNTAFYGLYSIHEIDLRKNRLITLDDRLFNWNNYNHDKKIYLGGNPFLCNCLVKWLKQEVKRRTEKIRMFSDIYRMRCNQPDYLKGKSIVRVSLKDFTCDHDYYYYYEYEEEGEKGDTE